MLRGHLTAPEVYGAVQEIAKSEQGAVTFASSLETLSGVYVATFNPEHERWNTYPDAARRALEVLNLFSIRPIRPLLLRLQRRWTRRKQRQRFAS